MPRDAKYDCLFEPVKIGPKTLKNRFYQVPHCNGAGTLRPGTQAAFRAMKAEGGWAAVCTEACSIDPECETAPQVLSTLFDAGDVANLRHMCDSLHSHGALAGVELMYAGPEASALDSRDVPRSPTQWASDYAYGAASHEMDEDDIKDVQQLWAEAAKRALQAGFDIIYVYGSHSVLPLQFLSPWYNKRTDNYGGSFENRARFWLETLAAVREAVDGQAAVATRLSVDQLIGPDGLQAQGESLKFVELATREGSVDVWDINICDFAEWGEDAGPSRFYKANHQAPFVRHVKGAAKAPVINVGRLTSPDDMVQVVTSGQADIIGSARASIADPFLPKKVEEGRLDDIRECIGCNICISRWERGTPLICTQNAVANEEYRRGWHPEKFDKTKSPCSVLVVGAGPAGMECARVLGLRGYDVHLVEAEAEIGGHVRNVIRLPGLSEWGRVITYRQIQLAKLKNVEVHTGTTLDAEGVLKYGADKVVLATGAHWRDDGNSVNTMAALEGVDAAKAQFATPEQLFEGKEVGDRVVVLDAEGYFMGVSLAEMLADRGKQVTVISHFGHVAPMTHFTLEAPNLYRMMREKGIKEMTSSWVEACEPGNRVKLRVYDLFRDGYRRRTDPKAGEPPRRPGAGVEVIEADTVVLATGRRSNDALYKALKARQGEWAREGIKAVYQAGDCYAPRFMADAVFDGHRLAREFESANPRKPRAYIRERMVWGQGPSPEPTPAAYE